MKKRLSMLLALSMLLTAIPMPGSASEIQDYSTELAEIAVASETESEAVSGAASVGLASEPASTERKAETETQPVAVAEEHTEACVEKAAGETNGEGEPNATEANVAEEALAEKPLQNTESMPDVTMDEHASEDQPSQNTESMPDMAADGQDELSVTAPQDEWVVGEVSEDAGEIVESVDTVEMDLMPALDEVETIGFYELEDISIEYRELEDGTIEIGGFAGSPSGDLVLPDSIDGKSVTSIADHAFLGCEFTGNLTLPECLTNIGDSAFYSSVFEGSLTLPKGLTNIGDNAFYSSVFGGSLTLPKDLTNIGSGAFCNSNFEGSIDLPEGLTDIGYGTFQNSRFTGELNLPKGLTDIGSQAFYNSKFMGSITFPEGLTDIGNDAFCNSEFSGGITLPKSLMKIGSQAFYSSKFTGSIILPEGLTSIGFNAFYNSRFTGELVLPESLTELGSSVFVECEFTGNLKIPKNLASMGGCFHECSFTGGLVLPDGMESIPQGTFSGYRFSGKLHLPKGLKNIGENAFSGCGFTGELVLPESIENVQNSAFWGCDFSGGLRLPEGLKKIGAQAFPNCNFTGDLVLPDSIETIGNWAFGLSSFTGGLVLPDGMESIPQGAFSDCRFLGSLHLPQKLKSIGENAFGGCGFTGALVLPKGLESVFGYAFSGCGFAGELALPDSLTTIGDNAFYECSGFTGELVFPKSLTSIGEKAFYGCNGFTGKLSVPETVTSIGKNAFFSEMTGGQNRVTEFFAGEDTVLDVSAIRYDMSTGTNKIWPIDNQSPYPLLTWSSSDESIAKVDAYGKVTAVSPGKATITAISYDGACKLDVPVRVLAKNASGYDTIAPAITGITFQESVVKPGVVTVSLDVIEEDTGITSCNLTFWHVSDNTQNLWCSYVYWPNGPAGKEPLFTGTHTMEMQIPSNVKSGEYYLSNISLNDQSGNTSQYHYNYTYYNGVLNENRGWSHTVENESYYANLNVNNGRNSLLVKDEFEVYFQSSVTNAAVTSKLQEMPDGSAAMILFDDKNHTVKKEWFEAIKGTEKTLVLSKDGIQWMFYGKDITTTKDIDCAVNVQQTGLWWEQSKRDEGLELRFASNGELPGKAKLRIKSDYILNMYNISKMLYLYFLRDDQTLSLEDMPQYILDGTEHWCEFELTHNSTFIVSGKQLSETERLQSEADANKPNTNAKPKASSVTLSESALNLKKGSSAVIIAKILPKKASQSVTWKSSNTKVATVTNGKVMAKNYGTAVITATANDGSGKSAQCKVTVGYRITYKLNGGKNHEKNPAAFYKTKVKLQNPSKKGFLFKGWYQDKKLKKKITSLSAGSKKDVTVYAKWEKIKVGKATVKSLKNTKGKKVSVAIEKISGATGYEVVYGTKKNLKGAKKQTSKKPSVTLLKGLSKNKTYYVKVRAYRTDSAKKKVYGAYSKVMEIKVTK